ncbi:MAG: hypothetical protein RIG61_04555 [Deltaproteobacteria bacterium]
MGSRGYIDAYQNPTKLELQEGTYKPQLTLRKRWQTPEPLVVLYIQFSAPKILFGNNFDELVDSDLDKILSELSSRLFDMGVGLRITDLNEAKVTKIHYAKNIVLPDYVIPCMVIGEVRKIDFNLHQELTERDYRNSGHSIRFHANDFELIFYDKKKDLQKSMNTDKRSIEKDNAIQLNLFEKTKMKKPFEVLRIEARLNTSNKIKSESGISKKDHTLKSLFSSQLSSKLLRRYWSNLQQNYRLLSYDIEDKEKFLASFIVNNPDARLSNALSTYALIEFTKQMGISKFRNLIDKKFSRRTWYGLKGNLNKYRLDGKLPDHFDAITNALKNYEPLHLNDYQD